MYPLTPADKKEQKIWSSLLDAPEPFKAWSSGINSKKGEQDGPGARARRQEKAAAKAA